MVEGMREAIVPLAAMAVLAFIVHRWAADELERERRLSPAAANAGVALFVLHALLVAISSVGGVVQIEALASVSLVGGSALAVVGATLALRAVRALGSRERVFAMRADEIVTEGPYAHARHPLYLGWVMALLGVAIAGRSVLALALVVLLAVALIRIARGEERWLIEELGPAYSRYRKKAPALLVRARMHGES